MVAFIKQSDFTKLRDEWVYGPNKTMSPDTFKRQMSPIRSAFNYCRINYSWPIPDVFREPRKFEWGKPTPHRERVLTPNELGRLFHEIDRRPRTNRHLWIAYMTVALWTGMRRGEMLNIEWRDVDLNDKRPTITIRPEIDKIRKGRTIPLMDRAWRCLMNHYTHVHEDCRTLNSKVFGANEVAIPIGMRRVVEKDERTGKYVEIEKPIPNIFGFKKRIYGLSEAAIEKAWTSFCKSACVENAHIHDLRHNGGCPNFC